MQTFFKNPRVAFRTSEFGGMLAICGFPISISLSQGGLMLALIGWLWFALIRRSGQPLPPDLWELHLHFPLELRIGVSIYAALLVSLLVNTTLAGVAGLPAPGARLLAGLRGELKDVLLISAAFWVLAYSGHEQGRRRLYRLLHITAWILVISGLVAIFSKFRLAKIPYHLMHGWVPGPSARLQHHLATLFSGSANPIHLYMPIGFMGTHLTYAALLSYVFPFMSLRVLHPFVQRPLALLEKANLRRAFFLTLALTVLLLNNGRSALLGLMGAMLLALYYFVRTFWRMKALRLLPPLLLIAAAVLLMTRVSPQVHYRFQNIMSALTGQSKHTDWQRVFVWQGTLDIIQRNPVWGVGPGAYEANIEEAILVRSQKKPRLWYAYALIQRGHAHSDLLHFMAIGGLPATALFLLLMVLLIRRCLSPAATLEGEFWKWGPLVIFAAGLYQCYFQDDEVILPFWILVGTTLRATGAAGALSGGGQQKPLP